jgi:hypothetical protein
MSMPLAFAFLVAASPLMAAAGMSRTILERDASGRTTFQTEPYEEDEGRHPSKRRKQPHRPETSCEASSSSSYEEKSYASDADRSAIPGFQENPFLQFSSGYSGLRVWTGLRTEFSSPSSSALSWKGGARLAGRGSEVRFRVGNWLARGGVFRAETTAHERRQGGEFVRETISLKGGWVEGGVQGDAADIFTVDLTLAAFSYHTRTSVRTNVPVFSYKGFSGDRLIPALGVGIGLQTPGSFPLHLFADAQAYIPFNPLCPDEKLLENGFGRVGAGISWRFKG